jgi:CDP-glucose 4,6-dehydratase
VEGVALNSEFLRGKSVFLTGHTGFKGSWLSLWLQRLGADVTGYALDPPTEPALFDVARVAEGMRSIIADVRDRDRLVREVRDAAPELVIHMAAQPLVRYSYQEPVQTYETNVMGTVHLLEAVRQSPSVRAVVVVTSDKCYENREWVWGYRENEPMGGQDPYSNSKGCTELVVSAYRASYFSDNAGSRAHPAAVGSGRAGNVIGGGDWAEDRLVPDLMRGFASGDSVRIRNPLAIRPWQHVLEPLAGYLTLAEKLTAEGRDFAQGWNFGPDEEDARNVQHVADEAAARWGGSAGWQLDEGAHPHEALSLKLDCSLAKAKLKWRPVLPLADGLDWTVEWYRAHASGHDMRKLTEAQIERYEARLQWKQEVYW